MSRADRAAVVVAAVSLVLLALALRSQPTASRDTPADSIERPTPVVIDRPTALIIGDSYTSGSGLAETSYGCRAAARMGWLCVQASEPGTGYISGGPANRFTVDKTTGRQTTSFGERIPGLGNAYRPDVVILDGGRSDAFAVRDQRFDVMRSTLWQVHATWPEARVVLVRPRLLGKPDDDLGFDDGFIAALRDSSGVDGLIVVDPVLPLRDSDTAALLAADGRDPNPRGEQVLGDALAGALMRSVPTT